MSKLIWYRTLCFIRGFRSPNATLHACSLPYSPQLNTKIVELTSFDDVPENFPRRARKEIKSLGKNQCAKLLTPAIRQLNFSDDLDLQTRNWSQEGTLCVDLEAKVTIITKARDNLIHEIADTMARQARIRERVIQAKADAHQKAMLDVENKAKEAALALAILNEDPVDEGDADPAKEGEPVDGKDPQDGKDQLDVNDPPDVNVDDPVNGADEGDGLPGPVVGVDDPVKGADEGEDEGDGVDDEGEVPDLVTSYFLQACAATGEEAEDDEMDGTSLDDDPEEKHVKLPSGVSAELVWRDVVLDQTDEAMLAEAHEWHVGSAIPTLKRLIDQGYLFDTIVCDPPWNKMKKSKTGTGKKKKSDQPVSSSRTSTRKSRSKTQDDNVAPAVPVPQKKRSKADDTDWFPNSSIPLLCDQFFASLEDNGMVALRCCQDNKDKWVQGLLDAQFTIMPGTHMYWEVARISTERGQYRNGQWCGAQVNCWVIASKQKVPKCSLRDYGGDEALEWVAPVTDEWTLHGKKKKKPRKNHHQVPVLLGVVRPNIRSPGQFMTNPATGDAYRLQQMAFNVTCHILTLFSDPGDRVLDCFAGTGTTQMACKRTGRRSVMVELYDDTKENAWLRLQRYSWWVDNYTGAPTGDFRPTAKEWTNPYVWYILHDLFAVSHCVLL
jgi:hypothetical protein